MNKKEIEEKLKLLNIVKEWLRTARWEGNIQSLANLILSFTEPKDKQIAELKKENAELKKQLENRNCSNCRRNITGCPNDGSCHNFSLWQPFKNSELKKGRGKMRYYKLNKIYVEYDELHGNFYHWNPITRIGKKDKISERTARKLVAKILTPIFEYEFMEMFDHVIWLKTPALEYTTIEGCVKI